jgi:hypothetical protein
MPIIYRGYQVRIFRLQSTELLSAGDERVQIVANLVNEPLSSISEFAVWLVYLEVVLQMRGTYLRNGNEVGESMLRHGYLLRAGSFGLLRMAAIE